MKDSKAQFTEPDLKKRTQFAVGQKWRKVFSGSELWQCTGPRGTKKQTQFKANFEITTGPRSVRATDRIPNGYLLDEQNPFLKIKERKKAVLPLKEEIAAASR